ncbi:MAG: hypothetical protein IT458_06285 [Planctomycetes bacterium]|nr:hypothetical protein [Planctomycetota bacterium]
MTDPAAPLSRREFLHRGAGALALGGLPGLALPLPRLGQRTRRVIVVAFAGGVRTKEVLGTPSNVPNLMRIAKAGVTFPNVRCANVGHYGAALSIFTGNVEAMGIRDNERGVSPTLFEVLRKEVGLFANDVWLSTASGAQGRLFAHSDHRDYGAAYAAQVLDGDGIFNVEFQKVLDSLGRPRRDSDQDRAILDRLGAALDPRQLGAVTGGKPVDAAELRAVETFILDELTGNSSRLSGPGAPDAKAIRVAANVLRVFKPRVLGITLQSADVAHGSYNAYVEVIRRNDEELGRLWDLVQADPELRATTAILVLPEFGRDADLNQRNGLDHGDGSAQMLQVFLVAAGPDFARDRVVGKEVRTIDVCPTVLSLFTRTKPAHTKARVLQELFA